MFKSKTDHDIEMSAKRDALVEVLRLPGWKIIRDIMSEIKEIPINNLKQKILGEVAPGEAEYIKGMLESLDILEKRIDFIVNGR